MKKYSLIILLTAYGLLLTAWAWAFYPTEITPGSRKVTYFLMPDQLYSIPSSALHLNQGMDEKLSLELTLVGYRSWYLITNSTYQFGLHSNYKFFDSGGLKFTGIAGLGGLSDSNIGSSLAFDFGLNASAGPVSLLILPSIFSDGVLMAYGIGFNFGLPFLPDKEVMLGGRGNLSFVSSEGRQAFTNRLYGILGARISL